MKTNELHVRRAVSMFTATNFSDLDLYIGVLRLISMTEGKGPLTLTEISEGYSAQQLAVVLVFLKDAKAEGLIEYVNLNGAMVYKHTKYFEDLVFWQKVKAGLIERPVK